MEYRRLGKAGVEVSRLCLGCMNFGGPTDENDSLRIIDHALDAGINFLDTENVYTGGNSEAIVGKAIRDKRDRVVLATKVHWPVGKGPNRSGSSRYHIMQQVEQSLRRLQTDHIDLYQLHRPDPDTPLEETLSALTDLVRQGKVRYLGTSKFASWELCEAIWTARVHGFEPVVCDQPPYSILGRRIENEVLPFCRKYGVGVIPFNPIAGGWLSGTYRRGQPLPAGSRGARMQWDLDSPRNRALLDAVEALIPLAEELGTTLSRFAMAWILHNPDITSPITGPRTLDQLNETLEALNLEIPEPILERVDAICPPGSDLRGYYQ